MLNLMSIRSAPLLDVPPAPPSLLLSLLALEAVAEPETVLVKQIANSDAPS